MTSSLSKDTLKLFPPKIMDEQAGVAPQFVCSICLAIPHVDPVTTSCDHFFCRDCLSQAMDHSDSCPYCQQDLVGDDENADYYAPLQGLSLRCWGSIPVQCQVTGCTWTGTMGDYASHMSHCEIPIVKRFRHLETQANRVLPLMEEKSKLLHTVDDLKKKSSKLKKKILTKDNEKSALLGKVSGLEQQLAKTKDDMTAEKNQNGAHRGTITGLEQQVRSLKSTNDNLKQEKTRFEGGIRQRDNTIKSYQREVASLKDSIDNTTRRTNAEKKEDKRNLSRLEGRVAALEKENKQLREGQPCQQSQQPKRGRSSSQVSRRIRVKTQRFSDVGSTAESAIRIDG